MFTAVVKWCTKAASFLHHINDICSSAKSSYFSPSVGFLWPFPTRSPTPHLGPSPPHHPALLQSLLWCLEDLLCHAVLISTRTPPPPPVAFVLSQEWLFERLQCSNRVSQLHSLLNKWEARHANMSVSPRGSEARSLSPLLQTRAALPGQDGDVCPRWPTWDDLAPAAGLMRGGVGGGSWCFSPSCDKTETTASLSRWRRSCRGLS